MSISWTSFIIGLLVGFILGAGFMNLFKKEAVPGDQILAWVISTTWVIWHISAGLSVVDNAPPGMYDVVSGGAVGFILGEKFWTSLTSFTKRK